MKERMKKKLSAIRREFYCQLLECSTFWTINGIDRKHGGVYTCLDRKGEIYSTDKSVWMQGRCAYTFARLCNLYGERAEWREAAESCLDFMEKYCKNPKADGRMYFTVTEDGRPLRQRRYFYSEAFYSMANAEYYALTGKQECLERARWAYDLYWRLWHGEEDPTGLGPKTEPETRTGRAFGYPMIYLNMSAVLEEADPAGSTLYRARAEECVSDILTYHLHPELSCLLESVGPNGEARLDFTEGRIVNPGHDIEGVWFLLEHAKRTGNEYLVECAEEIFNYAYRGGLDRRYGGLLYFIDACGMPPESYEHDMKLWWPHNELLISSLMLYRDTGKEKYLKIFLKTYKYCMKYFYDKKYGEWYGYLRRDGKPTMPPCKGSTFKGPFHLPRMLMKVDGMLGEILDER